MDGDPILLRTPEDVALVLAERLRALRLLAGYKRTTLARRAGVSAASLKRFENTGKVSLERLLLLCHVLERLEDFDDVLAAPPARTMAELEARSERPLPKRGRR